MSVKRSFLNSVNEKLRFGSGIIPKVTVTVFSKKNAKLTILDFYEGRCVKFTAPYRPSRGNGPSAIDGIDTFNYQLFETNNFRFEVRREFFRRRPDVPTDPRIPGRTREKTV